VKPGPGCNGTRIDLFPVQTVIQVKLFRVADVEPHLVTAGNRRVNWTEEGHNFSWHMMLREKEGEGTFIASDPATGEQWNVNLWDYLTLDQRRQMLIRPHMIIQFAHYLAGRLRSAGHQEVEIRARIKVSLNGRAPQLLIDPNVDLTKVPYPWWGHAPWILSWDPVRESQ
jgi:hypothetical protein